MVLKKMVKVNLFFNSVCLQTDSVTFNSYLDTTTEVVLIFFDINLTPEAV